MTDINETAVALAHDLVRLNKIGKIDLSRWHYADCLVEAVQDAGKLRETYFTNRQAQI